MFLYAIPLPTTFSPSRTLLFYPFARRWPSVSFIYSFHSFGALGLGFYFLFLVFFFHVLTSLPSTPRRRRDVRDAIEAGGDTHEGGRMARRRGGVLCIFM